MHHRSAFEEQLGDLKLADSFSRLDAAALIYFGRLLAVRHFLWKRELSVCPDITIGNPLCLAKSFN
jgi:hypothetical protein